VAVTVEHESSAVAQPAGTQNNTMRTLAVIFAIVSVTALAVGGVGLVSLRLAIESKHRLITNYEDLATNVQALQISSERRARKLRTAIITRKDLDSREHDAARQEFKSNLLLLESGFGKDLLRTPLARVRDRDRVLTTAEDKLMMLVRSNVDESTLARRLIEDILPAREELDDATYALRDQTERMLENARRGSDRVDHLAARVLGVTVGLTLLVIIGMGWMIQRTLDALAKAQQKLQQALTFEQQLMGIVGHDLLSPLSVVVLGATMLPAPSNPAEAAQFELTLNRIRRSAERAADLARLLMDTTRIRAGLGIPITPRPGELHSLVRELVDETRALNRNRVIQHQQAGDGRGWFDVERISQVVTNLLNNAVRHSPVGSRVDVTTYGGPAGLQITVHNEGSISGDLLPRIFEPFTKGSGGHPMSVGLGLYVARRLVEAHGGSIEVQSNERDGTTFFVRFPRTAQLVEPHSPRIRAHARSTRAA
jgi:signal transduction histidine kinase